MEMSDLYDLELSLFNGDMQLVGLTSPVASDLPQVSELGLQGVKCDPLPNSSSPQDYDVLVDTSSPSSSNTSGLLDSTWLDTRVDLLDLLSESSQLADDVSQPITSVAAVGAGDDHVELITPQELLLAMSEGATVQHIATCKATTSEPEVTGRMLMDVLSTLTDQLDASVDSQAAALNSDESVLSPMSAEDIESILSDPGSPESEDSSVVGDSILSDPDYAPESISPGPSRASRSKKRSAPCDVDLEGVVDKKQRKKMQNKNAALRYRQKKKQEQTVVLSEYEILEAKNKDLREKVDGITREITYLKNLMAEVYQAKLKKAGSRH